MKLYSIVLYGIYLNWIKFNQIESMNWIDKGQLMNWHFFKSWNEWNCIKSNEIVLHGIDLNWIKFNQIESMNWINELN